jgi:uncharacterized protein (TIGR02246 family)
MKRTIGLPILAACLAPAAAAEGPADEAAIRALQQQQASAWNAHDIAAYAALFTEDAHVINVLGWHWQSRTELKEKLGRGFASVFARSRLSIGAIDIEFLAPAIAVAHVRWTMTGAGSPTGAASDTPEAGIQTLVMLKRGRDWRIADFQNTNSVPERPLGAGRL